MTKLLFYEDQYKTECQATVESINGNEIVLDQTIAFAFSGGQASDSGTINGIQIKEAKKNEDKIIYVLESEPNFSIGETVKVKIDPIKRNKIMRLHSAIHIIHLFLEEKIGKKEQIGSNIDETKGRIDYDYPEPISKLLPELEAKANKLISDGLEIKTFYDEHEEGKRWWVCNDWHMPCGGTHPRNTKEIGQIKLKRKNIGAGKERIEAYLV